MTGKADDLRFRRLPGHVPLSRQVTSRIDQCNYLRFNVLCDRQLISQDVESGRADGQPNGFASGLYPVKKALDLAEKPAFFLILNCEISHMLAGWQVAAVTR